MENQDKANKKWRVLEIMDKGGHCHEPLLFTCSRSKQGN